MNKHECFDCFFRNKGEVWKTTIISVLKIGERDFDSAQSPFTNDKVNLKDIERSRNAL